MRHPFMIWTGGGPFDPEDGRRVEALDPPPDPEPLPRSALVTHWWGEARFEFAAVACSIRTTPWGDGRMTWLYYEGAQVAAGRAPDGKAALRTLLVPAHYVTAVRPGPRYQVNPRRAGDQIGLFPPNRPAPPHALPLADIERGLAGLADAPDDAPGFSIRYPLFTLRRPDGDHLGFGPHGDGSEKGESFGYAVFTTEAAAVRFLRGFERRCRVPSGARVERFDRLAAFRRFLRSIRDSGASVVFDPALGASGFLFADHAHPAAVVLERFLPQPAWGWSYPVYVLRAVGPGLTLILGDGHDEGGTHVRLLPVFTDADLADRALARAGPAATATAVPDSETFARLLRDLPAGFFVVFDHEPTRRLGNVVISREKLLDNLDVLEL